VKRLDGQSSPPRPRRPQDPHDPIVIAVAGCSGSGKTTLAAELARTLGGVHFQFDHYYRDLAHMPFVDRTRENFDDPALIESPLLIAHVAALAQGRAIDRPTYDFSTYTRVPNVTELIQPAPFLLIEGLFALYYLDLLPLYDLRIYVETPDDICFERRLRRDIEERARTSESVRAQYEATVRPSSIAFVRPSAAHADLIVDGTGDLDWKVERVLSEMRTRSLLDPAHH
jgi:uridine kinase